jgi:hypothetical protein
METINNSEAGNYVTRMEPFKNRNAEHDMTLYSRLYEPKTGPAALPTSGAPRADTYRYVVYSYGRHFPLYIAEWESGVDITDGGSSAGIMWYENINKYSVTTSKHKTQARPHHSIKTLPMTTKQMLLIAEFGTVGMIVYGGADE